MLVEVREYIAPDGSCFRDSNHVHDPTATHQAALESMRSATERISWKLGWAPAYAHLRDVLETIWRWHQSH